MIKELSSFHLYLFSVFILIIFVIINEVNSKYHYYTKYDIVCNSMDSNGKCKNYDLYYAGKGSSNNGNFIKNHCFKFDIDNKCIAIINLSIDKYKQFYYENFINNL